MTATGELCAMSDLPADWCAHCRGEDDPPREWERGPTFAARYPGRCVDCRIPIDVGDDVTLWRDVVSDAPAVYTHPGCTP